MNGAVVAAGVEGAARASAIVVWECCAGLSEHARKRQPRDGMISDEGPGQGKRAKLCAFCRQRAPLPSMHEATAITQMLGTPSTFTESQGGPPDEHTYYSVYLHV